MQSGEATGDSGPPSSADEDIRASAVNVYYSPDYVGAAYAFETTRKAKWVADSLSLSPIPVISLIEPAPLSRGQVIQVHDPEYARAIETGEPRHLAESQGFVWDSELWPMVLASNGGVTAAAIDALNTGLSGSLSSGLHHARRNRGAGFCTFNGLAIAAREALGAGAKSVLILDLDAHCGGGTASLIAADPRIWQMDVAVDGFDFYGSGLERESAGRVRLRLIQLSDRYLRETEQGLCQMAEQGPRFDLCLYNAGMDPFEGCSTGGLAGITRQTLAAREDLVFAWCQDQGIPVAFVLAGGYVGWGLDEVGLVDLHRLTLSAAASVATDSPSPGASARPPSPPES